MIVAAGNIFLNYHLLRISGCVYLRDYLFRAFGSVGDVHLLHSVKRMLPIIDARRRLNYHGIGKAERVLRKRRFFRGRGENDGLRIRDAEAVALLVELRLFDMESNSESGGYGQVYAPSLSRFLMIIAA